MTDVLRDLLQDSLQIVLCGTAAGTTSAARPPTTRIGKTSSGRFCTRLDLTPELLQPHQYRNLLQYRIGLTDLVKAGAGMDRATLPRLTAADRLRLSDSIVAFRPQFLAFTSKTAGQKFFNGKRDVVARPPPSAAPAPHAPRNLPCLI